VLDGRGPRWSTPPPRRGRSAKSEARGCEARRATRRPPGRRGAHLKREVRVSLCAGVGAGPGHAARSSLAPRTDPRQARRPAAAPGRAWAGWGGESGFFGRRGGRLERPISLRVRPSAAIRRGRSNAWGLRQPQPPTQPNGPGPARRRGPSGAHRRRRLSPTRAKLGGPRRPRPRLGWVSRQERLLRSTGWAGPGRVPPYADIRRGRSNACNWSGPSPDAFELLRPYAAERRTRGVCANPNPLPSPPDPAGPVAGARAERTGAGPPPRWYLRRSQAAGGSDARSAASPRIRWACRSLSSAPTRRKRRTASSSLSDRSARSSTPSTPIGM
jgi:hypothetical protein